MVGSYDVNIANELVDVDCVLNSQHDGIEAGPDGWRRIRTCTKGKGRDLPSIRKSFLDFASWLSSFHSAALSVAGCLVSFQILMNSWQADLFQQTMLARIERHLGIVIVRSVHSPDVYNIHVLRA